MHQTYTVGIFSRKERGFGNRIVFEANNLQCASLTTKLAFQAMVDRGAMTPNEWRETMNMTPIPGGDQPIRRLDTQVVNLLKDCLNKINTENYAAMTQVMVMLLKRERGEKKTKHKIDIRGAIIPNDYKWIYDWWEEDSTCPRDVQKVIDAVQPGDEIEVYINSPGGVIDAGSEIYTLLRQQDT